MVIKLDLKAPDVDRIFQRLVCSGWIVAQTTEETIDLVYIRPLARC